MARIIRIAQSLLPPATVLACTGITLYFSNSSWLHGRIHSLHKDDFTLQRSLNGVWLAETLLPQLLIFSLLLFYLLTRRLTGHHRWQWQRNFCLVTILTSITLVLRLWQCPFALDDAYIDYRYVLHWLSGQFDYNPGQHIMGFTSHLHLVALWFFCLLFHTQAVDMACYYLSLTAETACTILLYSLVVKVYGRTLPAFVAGLSFAASMFECAEVTTGKEAPLVTLFILLGLWGLKTSRPAILPWCANALFLLRPEGILACLVMLAYALKTQGRAALKSFIVPCGVTLTWYCFLLLYFGSILPHGMIAKHKVLFAGDFVSTIFGDLTAVGSMVTDSSLGFIMPALGWWSFIACAALAFVYAYVRFKEPCWALYRDLALAQLIFLLVVQPRIFSWYFCWLALLGPILVAQLAADAWPRAKTARSLWLMLPYRAAICLFMFVYLCTGFSVIPYNWVPYLERGVIYRQAALFLMDKTQGKETIAASDVGILGYFYTGPIIDVMGLISDETLKYYPIKTNHGLKYLVPPEAISALKPKYLMAPICHCQGMLLDDADFRQHYTEIKRWSHPDILDKFVCVWMRKED